MLINDKIVCNYSTKYFYKIWHLNARVEIILFSLIVVLGRGEDPDLAKFRIQGSVPLTIGDI